MRPDQSSVISNYIVTLDYIVIAVYIGIAADNKNTQPWNTTNIPDRAAVPPS